MLWKPRTKEKGGHFYSGPHFEAAVNNSKLLEFYNPGKFSDDSIGGPLTAEDYAAILAD